MRARPSRVALACSGSGLTSVSTSASGRPPMARTSARFVTTAAAPAPSGLLATKAGRIASPPSTRCSPACSTRAASSPSTPGRAPATRARSRLARSRAPGASRTTGGEVGDGRQHGTASVTDGLQARWRRSTSGCRCSAPRCANRARRRRTSTGARRLAATRGRRGPARALWGRHGARSQRGQRAAPSSASRAARPLARTVAPARRRRPRPRRRRTLLHSGPPIAWDRVCDPQRRALVAACLFEGWAADRDARRATDRGGRDRAGVRQRAQPRRRDDRRLLAVDAGVGGRGRGLGRARLLDPQRGARATRCGSGSATTRRSSGLRFFRDRVGPIWRGCSSARARSTSSALAAQGLHMGDELHMRSQATGACCCASWRRASQRWAARTSARFVAGNHHFFLPLTMAAAKWRRWPPRAFPGRAWSR